MKNFIILCLLLIPTGAFAWESFMDKCIASWIGYPLDSVINRWGYPEQEKTIAGKHLYIWETYDYDTDIVEGTGMTFTTTDKKGRETSFTTGGQLKLEYCKKILEVDKNNVVLNGQAEGGACPKFYFVGKKLVNPENNDWENKKGNK